jgi:hypothetical protein
MSVPYIYELVVDFLLADGRILKPRRRVSHEEKVTALKVRVLGIISSQ